MRGCCLSSQILIYKIHKVLLTHTFPGGRHPMKPSVQQGTQKSKKTHIPATQIITFRINKWQSHTFFTDMVPLQALSSIWIFYHSQYGDCRNIGPYTERQVERWRRTTGMSIKSTSFFVLLIHQQGFSLGTTPLTCVCLIVEIPSKCVWGDGPSAGTTLLCFCTVKLANFMEVIRNARTFFHMPLSVGAGRPGTSVTLRIQLQEAVHKSWLTSHVW